MTFTLEEVKSSSSVWALCEFNTHFGWSCSTQLTVLQQISLDLHVKKDKVFNVRAWSVSHVQTPARTSAAARTENSLAVELFCCTVPSGKQLSCPWEYQLTVGSGAEHHLCLVKFTHTAFTCPGFSALTGLTAACLLQLLTLTQTCLLCHTDVRHWHRFSPQWAGSVPGLSGFCRYSSYWPKTNAGLGSLFTLNWALVWM